MGNNQSNFKLYCKLCRCMPPIKKIGGDNDQLTGWLNKSPKPFVSDGDRDQFVYATITVLSQNGTIDINDHDFRLLYSRRESDRLVARIVAEKGGVVIAQIEPAEDAKNQLEAFFALRRHVERRLDSILRNVPGAASSEQSFLDHDDRKKTAGPSETGRIARSPPTSPRNQQVRPERANGLPAEAPPAYGNAVKDWRASEGNKV